MRLYAMVWDPNAMVWDSNAIYTMRCQCYAMVYVVKDMPELTVIRKQ